MSCCMQRLRKLYEAIENIVLYPCKFTHKCQLYDPEGYYCTHGGGNDCGQYRKLTKFQEHQ